MEIHIVNESTRVSKKDFGLMVRACAEQLNRDAAPAYGLTRTKVKTQKTLDDVPPTAWPIVILDDSDEADALGYHDQTPDGRPYGRVFVSPVLDSGGTVLRGANSVSATLSHEVLEMWWDPQVNLWYQAPDGRMWAGELCDAVENKSYDITVSGINVAVSNFVLQPFFDCEPEKGAKFDFLGQLKKPFSIAPEGYAIIIKTPGKVTYLYGKRFPKHKLPSKRHAAARSFRRSP